MRNIHLVSVHVHTTTNLKKIATCGLRLSPFLNWKLGFQTDLQTHCILCRELSSTPFRIRPSKRQGIGQSNWSSTDTQCGVGPSIEVFASLLTRPLNGDGCHEYFSSNRNGNHTEFGLWDRPAHHFNVCWGELGAGHVVMIRRREPNVVHVA